MIETAAALVAGFAVMTGVLAVAAPPRQARIPRLVSANVARWWARESTLAAGTGWAGLDARTLVALQVCAALAAAICATSMTGLMVLAVPAAAGGASGRPAGGKSPSRTPRSPCTRRA